MLYTWGMTDDVAIPAADYDSPWKEALAQFLPDALALFFPAIHAQIDWDRGYILHDKELQQVTHDADLGRRLADLLVQVWRRDGAEVWVLIHIEVQGQPEADFARRMFVYHYSIYDRYARPILSLAVLADEQGDWRPDRFVQELWGCTVEMRYPVVKLLDYRARVGDLATNANPFAVVVRAHLAAQETRGADGVERRQQAKIGLIRGLYERGYDRAQVLGLFRLVDWLLMLPEAREQIVWREIERIEEERRMPYITSVERIGRAEGLAEGRAEGVLDGQRAMLRRFVQLRFGAVPEPLEQQIAAADQDGLERLAQRVNAATSLTDVLGADE